MQIMNTALFGLQTAQTQFAKSAESIASLASSLPQAPEQFEIQDDLPPVAPINAMQSTSSALFANEVSLENELVNMTVATMAYEANAYVFGVAEEVLQTTISELT